MFRFLLASLALLFLANNFGMASVAQDKIDKKIPKPETVESVKNILPKHIHSEKCESTTAEPVQIICILDRSGSMHALVEDTIGGYNSFIEKQKKESGKAEVTTILFDDKYEKITDSKDLQQIEKLTSADYYARGNTALLDALGKTIMEIAGKMEKENICPEKRRVLIMIMTDGKENASTEYNKATIKKLVEETTKNYGWNYIFMGANIDSMAEASSIGIRRDYAVNYSHDEEGVAESFGMMNKAASSMRKKGNVSENWKE